MTPEFLLELRKSDRSLVRLTLDVSFEVRRVPVQ